MGDGTSWSRSSSLWDTWRRHLVDVKKEIAKLMGLSRWRLEVRCGGESHPEHGGADQSSLLSLETQVNEKLSVSHPMFAW